MEDWTLIDDAIVMSETMNFDSDMTSDDWNHLSLNPPYCTNGAEIAGVPLGFDTNTNNYTLLNTYPYPINQGFYNPNELFAPEHTYIDTLPVDWDFMMLPTLIEGPSSTTLTGSNTTTEPPDYTSTYTTSSASMAHSPAEPEPLQVSDHAPEQTVDDKGASTTNTRRRTKMKPGTRPCDLKRAKRKVDKPEICLICQKGHQWRRELNRHYRTNHPVEAEKMGISMARPVCRYCGKDFARRDHLKRHLKRKHGG
jgi:hypothetical protein